MGRTVTFNDDGSMTVKDDLGKNANGSDAVRQWDVAGVAGGDQIKKMAATFAQPDPKISAGDVSAGQDAIQAHLKQLAS